MNTMDMHLRTVDLNNHVNETHDDSLLLPPVKLTELYASAPGHGKDTVDPYMNPLNRFQAVQRQDTGETLAVVGPHYQLVQHADILRTVKTALAGLDIGPTPYGIYTHARGAGMNAIFKFPALAKTLDGQDRLCPMIRVSNSYDTTSRICLELGAFRFVCTNFAIGGTGLFAGGFRSVHIGYQDLNQFQGDAQKFLGHFDDVMKTYGSWAGRAWSPTEQGQFTDDMLGQPWPQRHKDAMFNAVLKPATVFEAYNALTSYATHGTRSAQTAFRLLAYTNSTFARIFDSVPQPGDEAKHIEASVL